MCQRRPLPGLDAEQHVGEAGPSARRAKAGPRSPVWPGAVAKIRLEAPQKWRLDTGAGRDPRRI